jgi:hypothetical protein
MEKIMEDNEDDFESEDVADEEQDKLAEEFEAHCIAIQVKIQKKIDAASKLLDEATTIAEENGVPFYSSISPLGQSYMPGDLGKFSELDQDRIEEIAGVCGEYLFDYNGWQHSAVC